MSIFVKAMRFVGDLDDEFYRDERQRDVWNEASAVGFQLLYWIVIIVSAILPWIAGTAGGWIALGSISTISLISWITMAYAKAASVDMFAEARTRRPRGIAAGVLVAIGLIGAAARLKSDDYLADSSSIAGVSIGALVGGGIVAALIMHSKRKKARFEAEDEF